MSKLYTEVKNLFNKIYDTKYYTNYNDEMLRHYGGSDYMIYSDRPEIDKYVIDGEHELIGTFFDRNINVFDNVQNPCVKLFNENGFHIVSIDAKGYDNSESDGCYSIYKFEKNGKECFVKFNGWYSSYGGSEFTKYFEVIQTEKTIIVYEQA